MSKYLRTKLSNELHGEVKKECAINGISMQDYVANLITADMDEKGKKGILAMRLAEFSKSDIQLLLKKAKEFRK
ncbi:MAG TPA: hypothetical protein VK982_00725 [Bacteroidales bacterium]|nr:hypothetical protein [Bacteroidales bacterium]